MAELISNPNFDTDVSGWLVDGTLVTATWVAGGYMQVDRNSASIDDGIYTSISTVIGLEYTVTADIFSLSNQAQIGAWPTSDLALGSELNLIDESTTGIKQVTFTATGTTTYIGVKATAAGAATVKFDSISAKEVTLISNPDFDTDVSGWLVDGTLVTATWVTGGYMQVDRNSASIDDGIYTSITTTIGETYTITTDIFSLSHQAQIGAWPTSDLALGSELNLIDESTTGTSQVIFTATGTTTYIGVKATAATSATVKFDSVNARVTPVISGTIAFTTDDAVVDIQASLINKATVVFTTDDAVVAIEGITAASGTIVFTTDDAVVNIEGLLDVPIGQIIFTTDDATVAITGDIKNAGSLAFTTDDAVVDMAGGIPSLANISFAADDAVVSVLGVVASVIEPFSVVIRHKTTGAPITGLTTVLLKISNPSDDTRWDFSDKTFKASPITESLALTEIDATNQAGLYRGDVTTTTWSGWIEFEATYDDGSFVYSFPDEAYYSDGVRANGAWSIAEIQKIDAIGAKTSQMRFTKEVELDVNVQSVNDGAVSGTGAHNEPWGP